MRFLRLLAFASLVSLTVPSFALGAGSGSYEPSTDPEIQQYNKGVDLMLKKKFEKAEKWFRKALAERDDFAEAHNNLAYCLRKQGKERFAESLQHYNRAVDIDPGLPEPYMYRGVLHVQMGNLDKANADLDALTPLSRSLASELAYVIKHKREKEPEQFFGVSRELE